MPANFMDLKNVRLSYDERNDSVRLSSSDPLLEGESFVMNVTPGTRAEALARGMLKASGVHVDNNVGFPEGLVSGPAFSDPLTVPIGLTPDHFQVSLSLAVPTLKEKKIVLVTGRTGSGKSVIASAILAKAKALTDEYDVHYYEFFTFLKNSPKRFNASATFDVETTSKLPKSKGKRRIIILDGVDFQGSTGVNTIKLIEAAEKHGDLVILTAQRYENWLQYADVLISLNNQDLRSRIEMGIDRAGRLGNYQGAIRNMSEPPSTAKAFSVYKMPS